MKNIPISYLNSNDGSGLIAFGEGDKLISNSGTSLVQLSEFIKTHSGSYIFGILSYDLKNEIENLTSNNKDGLNLPDVCFWTPKYVVKLRNEHFDFIQGEKNSESLEFLNYFLEEETDQNFHKYDFNFTPRISKEEYIEQVKKLKAHIQIGNIYEVNFCQEFYAENVSIEYAFDAYFKLNNITKAPFSCYFHMDDFSIFGGSPERFLKKVGTKLISEPIKGTAKRGLSKIEDDELIKSLVSDPKERAENIMIVDLVRNDLSKIATKNSVQVEELCQIYSFETVHQMISRISCDIKESTSFTEIIKATFPMGSMTGVPKIRAMELIEEHESFKRGIYSGSIGYIKPNGDFDFNVVIRSLVYNQNNNYLSCAVGGAITIHSDPEKEYEECLIKVKRILDGMNE